MRILSTIALAATISLGSLSARAADEREAQARGEARASRDADRTDRDRRSDVGAEKDSTHQALKRFIDELQIDGERFEVMRRDGDGARILIIQTDRAGDNDDSESGKRVEERRVIQIRRDDGRRDVGPERRDGDREPDRRDSGRPPARRDGGPDRRDSPRGTDNLHINNLEHLRHAANVLQQAGLHDLAGQLREHAARLRRGADRPQERGPVRRDPDVREREEQRRRLELEERERAEVRERREIEERDRIRELQNRDREELLVERKELHELVESLERRLAEEREHAHQQNRRAEEERERAHAIEREFERYREAERREPEAPPMAELHDAIHNLREQLDGLRREVRELREQMRRRD